MITIGNTFPDTTLTVIEKGEQKKITSQDFFDNKKIIIFGLPGAFTPACSNAHVPDYLSALPDFQNKSIDAVVCLSLNDAFVMQAWQQQQSAEDIDFIADGGGALTKTLGLELDTGEFGGVRSARYSMFVDNQVVRQFNLEQGTEYKISDPQTILSQL